MILLWYGSILFFSKQQLIYLLQKLFKNIQQTSITTFDSQESVVPQHSQNCNIRWLPHSHNPSSHLVPESFRSAKGSFQITQPFQNGKNHGYLGQVLTLTLVILNRVKFFDIDKLIVFVGTVFLPHLQVEQNNNPSSPLELWKCSEYTDNSKVEGASNYNILRNYHCENRFHHDFKTHLMGNCKFVVELCTKETVHYANPNPVQVPNLELQLVLIDRVLESKAKGVQDKKRKLLT